MKTAFVRPDGLWDWLVVPQGITTPPVWFMRMVSELLHEHTSNDYSVVFMDDIEVYSNSENIIFDICAGEMEVVGL